MRSQIVGLRTAGTLFAILSLVQLARLVIRPEVLVSGHQMPLWPSVIAFLALGAMSWWMFAVSWPHGHDAKLTDSP